MFHPWLELAHESFRVVDHRFKPRTLLPGTIWILRHASLLQLAGSMALKDLRFTGSSLLSTAIFLFISVWLELTYLWAFRNLCISWSSNSHSVLKWMIGKKLLEILPEQLVSVACPSQISSSSMAWFISVSILNAFLVLSFIEYKTQATIQCSGWVWEYYLIWLSPM